MPDPQSLPRLMARGLPAEGGSLSARAFRADYVINRETGCWEWQKWKLRGYGRVTVDGVPQWAHRAYYEAAFGPVPEGLDVHHRCENPSCVNPEHLEALTQRAHRRGHWVDRIKLTQEQIAEIRELGRDQSLRQIDIAERFGITRSMVSTLLNGQSWASDGERFRPEGRICLLPGCDNEVHGRRNKRFCSPAHRGAYNSRKVRASA